MSKESLINQLLAKELVVNWSLNRAVNFYKQSEVSIAFRDGWDFKGYHSKDFMKVVFAKDGKRYIRERALRDPKADVIAEATGLEFGFPQLDVQKRYVTHYFCEEGGNSRPIDESVFVDVLEHFCDEFIEALALRESRFMSSTSWSHFRDLVKYGLA